MYVCKEKKKEFIKRMAKIILSIIILMSSLIIYNNQTFAYSRGDHGPILVSKIKRAFERIQEYLIIVSTPAAGVAICTGLLMRKFSFGDEERIRTSKKLIRGTIFAYAFILCTKFVIDLIQIIFK